jgi:threonyl-tRNA synthetase
MHHSLSLLRTFSAKLLGYVLCDVFPNVQLVQGGEDSIGFYYDCLLTQQVTEEVLPLIEERFGQICHDLPECELMHMMRENAEEFFRYHKQPLLAERAAQAPENIVELIKIGTFHDLYAAAELPDHPKIKAFKFLSLTHVDIYDPALGKLHVVRISGTVFEERSDLKAFMKKWAVYKKGAHQKFGAEMGLFHLLKSTREDSWIFFPRGESIRDLLLNWCQQGYQKQGYQKIGFAGLIPESFFPLKSLMHPVQNARWKFEWEEEGYLLPTADFSLAPLAMLSQAKTPLRFFEVKQFFTRCQSDDLVGLLRSRTYQASFAHLFCSDEQLLDEMISCLQFIDRTVKVFGFEHQWILYPKAEKNAFAKNRWAKALEFLHKALKFCGLTYEIDETSLAWAGPRIEVKLMDSLGRLWSGPQVELDFYHLEHTVLAGQTKSQYVANSHWGVRWTALGSIERAIALLLEQKEGYLPLWIAPEQVRILPVGEDLAEYAKQLMELMINQNLRVAIDESQEALGEKIFAATQQKIPYIVIVGSKEKRENRMTVRSFGHQAVNASVKIEDFLSQMQEKIHHLKDNEH